VTCLKSIPACVQGYNIPVFAVCFRFINFIFKISPLFVPPPPEMSTSFTSRIVQIAARELFELCFPLHLGFPRDAFSRYFQTAVLCSKYTWVLLRACLDLLTLTVLDTADEIGVSWLYEYFRRGQVDMNSHFIVTFLSCLLITTLMR
jgi:hypothetical protein